MAEDGNGKRGRGGRHKPVNWLAIRTDYLNGETNTAELARKHGTSRETISRKMTADKKRGQEWVSRQEINHGIITGVMNEAVGKVAAEEAVKIAENLARHGEVETLLLDVAIDTLRRVKGGTDAEGNPIAVLRSGTHSSEAEERKQAIEAAIKAIDASRLVRGIQKDKPSVGDGEPEDKGLEIIQRRVEPVKIAVGEDGRAIPMAKPEPEKTT